MMYYHIVHKNGRTKVRKRRNSITNKNKKEEWVLIEWFLPGQSYLGSSKLLAWQAEGSPSSYHDKRAGEDSAEPCGTGLDNRGEAIIAVGVRSVWSIRVARDI